MPGFQAGLDALNKNKPMPLNDFDTAYETHRVVFGRPVKLKELS